jgi:cysteine desulfurase
MTPINLDNNATTEPSPEVVDAVRHALTDCWHNPSSAHRAGQAARREVELARQSLAALINAKPRDIVLTSGGTESVDLGIRGALAALPPERRTLATTRVEHAAVRDLAEQLEKQDPTSVVWIPVDRAGIVDVAALESLLASGAARKRPVGVLSVQWANNETGAVQPVRLIARACRGNGALFHCDGTQWVGKMPADVEKPPDDPAAIDACGCDLLTFSPHKFHGPKGVGVLWSRRGVRIGPRLLGAQELGRRGGTENVPGIAGARVAAELARAWLADGRGVRDGAELRDRFEAGVRRMIPDAVVNGPTGQDQRLWNTSNIGFPRLEAEALILLLSERGLWASAGAACSSGSLEPSPVLLAMGVPPEIAHGSIRFSLSRHTTAEEIDRAIPLVAGAVEQLRRSSASV